MFEGLEQSSKVFYGFTVASLDLAWQLAKEGVLPALDPGGRRLEATVTPLRHDRLPAVARQHPAAHHLPGGGRRRWCASWSRSTPGSSPARPLALSQLLPKTRGGTDWSGPLPQRSLPGFEIAGANDQAGLALADVQICAYQVAMR